MDLMEACELLSIINGNAPSECTDDVMQLLSRNIEKLQLKREISDEKLDFDNLPRNISVNKYLVLSFHLLNDLKALLMASDDALNVLSLQQNKMVREALHELTTVGIRFNLQPKVPQQIKPRSRAYTNEAKSMTTDYDRLCYTTKRLIGLLPCPLLRPLVVFVGLQAIMNALYQIIYCPLSKPGTGTGRNLMTLKLYTTFQHDKDVFTKLLVECERILPRSIFVKETMLLLKTECRWFEKGASANLTKLLRSPGGVLLVVNALLEDSKDYSASDSAKSWKATVLIAKLIVSLRPAPDFETNICEQLVALGLCAGSKGGSERVGNAAQPYEMIFATCVKYLYSIDDNASRLCRRCLLVPLMAPLHRLLAQPSGADAGGASISTLRKFENNDDVTDALRYSMRLLKLVFASDRDNAGVFAVDLPYNELTTCIVAIFRCYAVTILANASDLSDIIDALMRDSEVILIDYFLNILSADRSSAKKREIIIAVFDAVLFGFQSDTTPTFRSDLALKLVKHRVLISTNADDITACHAHAMQAHVLLKLLKNYVPTFPTSDESLDLQLVFFFYLLNCLTNKEKYFTPTDGELAAISRNLLVCNVLSMLADDVQLQRCIVDDPTHILKYIADALESAARRGVHRSGDRESSEFRTISLLIMILQELTTAGLRGSAACARVLSALQVLLNECVDEELRALAASVIRVLTTPQDCDNDKHQGVSGDAPPESELDKITKDIYNTHISSRAYGLRMLRHLVEDKHPEVLERKMYVLNIFQQNLRDGDSFIYLSAIKGLTLMADAFPDEVLEILLDEYSGMYSDEEDEREEAPDEVFTLRMKLGEVLIRVSRNLGDRASKYKSRLINTFMFQGTKDDDSLIRASNLSNLGEICQVLGYKLGTIVTEVLHCVHGAMMDSAVEARRAAVSVIRQLFVGLRDETLAFLKDEIADIYRTLRRIYEEDADDIMRLHAQLALEELEVNIKAFPGHKLSG